MKKKMISICITVLMLFTAYPIYAMSAVVEEVSVDLNISQNNVLRSNKEVIVKEFVNSKNGTKYNGDKTKKVIWKEDRYKVYYKNVATGVKHFQYDQYEWEWDGYELQKNGKWKFVEHKSGVNREHFSLPF